MENFTKINKTEITIKELKEILNKYDDDTIVRITAEPEDTELKSDYVKRYTINSAFYLPLYDDEEFLDIDISFYDLYRA